MKMTVYFDGNFWLGLIEYDDDGDYKVFRYFFGKEPKDDDVFNFLICKIKLDRKKPFMLGSDKHHICLKGTNINDLYPSYHK
ncbi:Protein of uncharacterised function (DUF2992) [Streptococcus agalactiae]|nr:hypothetical protein SAG0170_08130 [Streptococcus agalactiae LDS 617]SUN10764.1 Protein of uncharacterised function (DUF2992) [Streptococcus agalactiae]